MALIDTLASAQGGAFFANIAAATGLGAAEAKTAVAAIGPAIAAQIKNKAEADPEAFEDLLDLLEDGGDADLDNPRALTGGEAVADGNAILTDIYGSRNAAIVDMRKLAGSVAEAPLEKLAAIAATAVLAALARSHARVMPLTGAPAAAETGGGLLNHRLRPGQGRGAGRGAPDRAAAPAAAQLYELFRRQTAAGHATPEGPAQPIAGRYFRRYPGDAAGVEVCAAIATCLISRRPPTGAPGEFGTALPDGALLKGESGVLGERQAGGPADVVAGNTDVAQQEVVIGIESGDSPAGSPVAKETAQDGDYPELAEGRGPVQSIVSHDSSPWIAKRPILFTACHPIAAAITFMMLLFSLFSID